MLRLSGCSKWLFLFLRRVRPILHELPTEAPFDTQVTVAYLVIQRRGDFDNLVVLYVQRQRAPDATIRTDRIGVRLLGFIPDASLTQFVFAAEHECACGTDTDTIPAVDTGGLRKRHSKLGGNTGVKATTGNSDGKRILRVYATGFHTFVTEDAAGIITDVEFVIDLHWLGDRLAADRPPRWRRSRRVNGGALLCTGNRPPIRDHGLVFAW